MSYTKKIRTFTLLSSYNSVAFKILTNIIHKSNLRSYVRFSIIKAQKSKTNGFTISIYSIVVKYFFYPQNINKKRRILLLY